jgi:ABC-type methionine transport system ATPase subunit
MIRQGQILDEYIYRHNIEEPQEDGKQRNLSNPVENARYWLTYAHEAVAYQAIQVYIFNLNGQANIKNDINAQINNLASSMNVLKGKVDKSQKLIADLVAKD